MLKLVIGVVIGVAVVTVYPEVGTYVLDAINGAASTVEKATADQNVVERTIDRIASIDVKEWSN